MTNYSLLGCALLGAAILAGPANAQEPEDLFRHGVALMDADRPLEAEAVFRTLLAREPRNDDARVLVGFLLLGRGVPDQAETEFKLVLRAKPDHPMARLGLGTAQVQLGALGGAAREFESLLDDPQVGVRARVQWIQTLFIAGKDDEAFAAARSAVESGSGVPEYHESHGFLLTTRGRRREAVRAYGQALLLNPDRLSSIIPLVSLHMQVGEWEEALAWCERALELDTANPLLHRSRAAALEHLGRRAEAADSRREAVRVFDAEQAFIESLRARRKGDHAEEERHLRRATELNPQCSRFWARLGDLRLSNGRLEGARSAFQMALETDPQNARAYLGLSSLLRAEDRRADAIALLRRGLSRGVAGPDIRAGLAALLWDTGNSSEAASEMEAAIRDFPAEASLVSYLADLRESLGAAAGAREGYETALRLDPGNLAALEGQIHSLLDAGESSAAEAAARRCLEKARDNTYCREVLACIFLDAGKYREAAEHYDRVLRLGAETKTALEGLAFALTNVGARARAVTLYETSLGRFGDDPSVRAALGYIHRRDGHFASAAAQYRRARLLSPEDAGLARELGLTLYLGQDYEAAKDNFLAALSLRPRWGQAHYDLALAYWHLAQPAAALAHAREAERLGVPEARRTVAALTSRLSLGIPRTVDVFRTKR